MKSYMKYFKDDVVVVADKYHDGTTALMLRSSNDGEPIAKATVNLGDMSIEPNIVYIKDYSENEGVLWTLLMGNIIETIGLTRPAGFEMVEAARIIDKELLKEVWLV
jgi:hypothetical protein